MALIEGVGDEVTLLFGSLLLLMVLLLAWISTRTSEPLEHLFNSSTGSVPTERTGSTHHDTSLSSTDSISASSSLSSSSVTSSVSDNSLSEAPPTSTQEEGGAEGGGGLRSRGGGELLTSQRNMVVRLKFLNDTESTDQVKPQDTFGYIKR